jgi:hypothetical protein
MKSKIFLCAAIMGLFLGHAAWSLGIGAQFNGNISTDGEAFFIPGWALALSPSHELHLSFFWDFSGEQSDTFGITADFWLLNPGLIRFGSGGSLNFFIGPGLFGSFSTGGGGDFSFGLRLPVGLNLLLVRSIFEVYLEAAPSWGLHFYPSLSLNSHVVIPVSLGFRVWFG